MRRPTSLFSSLVLSLALVLTACGGSGGDDDDDTSADPDASASVADAGDVSIDATVASHLGESCTGADPNSCEGDFTCYPFATAWCSTTCTMMGMVDPACSAGYDGPGLAGCFVTATPPGGAAINICGVICQAPTAACPANICDGTCPGALTCGTPDGDGIAICQ